MRLGTRGKVSLVLGLLQFVAGAAAAQRVSVEQLFPAVPAGYVVDQARIIPADRSASMAARIDLLRQRTGAEIAVVTLPTLGSYEPVDVAVSIGRTWKVGAAAEIGDARRNAGVVMLIVPRTDSTSGQMFIATGRGVEGFVTDAVAGRIRDRMRPLLSAGDYGAGIERGVTDLVAVIATGFGVTDTSLVGEDRSIFERRDRPAPREAIGIVVAGVIILLVMVIAISRGGGGSGGGRGRRYRSRRGADDDWAYWLGAVLGSQMGRRSGSGGSWGGGSWGGGGGGGGFGGFGGGGGFSGGGAGGSF
ncbi:MAG: TPM domain-containing protein [Gemmatimonadales bacterium]